MGASDAMLKGLGEFHELTSLDLSQSTSRDTSKMTATGLEVILKAIGGWGVVRDCEGVARVNRFFATIGGDRSLSGRVSCD